MIDNTERDTELIRTWIRPDPRHSGVADARIAPSGVSVWALIGYILATAQYELTGNAAPEKRPPVRELEEIIPRFVESIAADYEIPAEAVEAALAYFRRYPRAMLCRIAENDHVSLAMTQ